MKLLLLCCCWWWWRVITTPGDVASIDGFGYMRIQDRSKDVIKSGGEWISSIQLENAAMGHPKVNCTTQQFLLTRCSLVQL